MAYDIGPLRDDEIEALSRFLTSGFGTSTDALFAAPDVLRWKFLAPRGEPNAVWPRSLVARNEVGQIVGHVGWVPTTFIVHGGDTPARSIPAVHMIDWLGSPEHKGVGGALMRRVNSLAPVQYGFGGTSAGRTVIKGAGFTPQPPVAIHRCVLRPLQALRGDTSFLQRGARVSRDTLRVALRTVRERVTYGATPQLKMSRIETIGPLVDELRGQTPGPLVQSAASIAALNALLAFPRGEATAWQVDGEAIMVLNVVISNGARVGKIVDVVMPGREVNAWRRVMIALRNELQRQGADVVLACGSTPWEAAALRGAGFQHAFDLEFSLRDRSSLIPAGVPTHLSFMEADYAYLP